MNTPAHPQLLLTKPTFVCLTDNTLVFLDLHNDKYSCLEVRHTKPIGALLGLAISHTTGAETDAPQPSDAADDADVSQVVQDLFDRDLATRDPDRGKRAELITQAGELRELLGYEIGQAPKVRADHVLNFFKALIITKSMLRFASIERTVMRVRRRKERHHARAGNGEPDPERVNELVEIYKILKPLFVTVKDNCLFNSLFLIEFLACYRVYPSWYFGVKLNEFTAHCWVQDGNVIYDDTILHTYTHKPIMAA